MQAGGIFGEGVVEVGDDGEVFVIDLDGFYSAIGGVFIFCKDDGNGVAAIEDFVFGEDGVIAVDEALAVCAGHVLGGVDGDDAGGLRRGGGIDLDDAGVGLLGADDACEVVGAIEEEVCAVEAGAEDFFGAVDAALAAADRAVGGFLVRRGGGIDEWIGLRRGNDPGWL